MEKIVAIDLGTSHITGVVGERGVNGIFTIIASETKSVQSCIRRGNIRNLNDTAAAVKEVISGLERRLNGDTIEKVYVGVGGQSLRSIDHSESIKIAEGAVVTDDDVQTLKNRCDNFKPDLQDVLFIATPVYYTDGHQEVNPVGVSCKNLEAKYKIIVGRSSIKRDVLSTIEDRLNKEVAGIIVSPLALSDAMLSEEEKSLGCALVDFGAGVTSVSVYNNGSLIDMSVIPLGGNLITKDIETLQVTSSIAEKIKRENGKAILTTEDDSGVIKVEMEGASKEIELNSLNTIVEARAKEIVENVNERIRSSIEINKLGSGIVLAGCASALKKLDELMKEVFKISNVRVRFSAIRGGLVNETPMTGDPTYMTAIGIMLKGTDDCVARNFMQPENDTFITEEKPEEDKKQDIPKTPKKPRKNIGDAAKRFVSNLFGDE